MWDKVEFILPGSTTTDLKKVPICQVDEACSHFGTPLREGQKRRSWIWPSLSLGRRCGRAFATPPTQSNATLRAHFAASRN